MTALTLGGAAATGITAAAYTNSFAAACRTTLHYLDSSSDRLLISGDPNAGLVTDVGALGFNGDANSGFEIVTGADGSNTALVVASVGGAPTLYTVPLATGTAVSSGAVTGLDAGESLRGLAIAPPATAPIAGRGQHARGDGDQPSHQLQQHLAAETVHGRCRDGSRDG